MPVCTKEYVRVRLIKKTRSPMRGPEPSSALKAGGVDVSNPSPLRLLPTTSEWMWASTFSVSNMVGRRLPRLYRKILFAVRAKADELFLYLSGAFVRTLWT